jgi:hypothetical protein
VTPAERDAIARVLDDCPSSPAPAATTSTQSSTDPEFDSCRQARAAGFGPYTAGVDPEYDWYRDGDGDGTVCE